MQTKYLLLHYFHLRLKKCPKFLSVYAQLHTRHAIEVAYHISSFLSCGIQKKSQAIWQRLQISWTGLPEAEEARTQQLKSRVSKNFTLLHPPNSRGRPAISYSLDLDCRDYAEFSLLPSLFPFLLSSILCVREPGAVSVAFSYSPLFQTYVVSVVISILR